MAKSKRMKDFQEKIEKNRNVFNAEYFGQPRKDEKMAKCEEFFNELTDILKNQYEMVCSCNKDASKYLVPIGTSKQISYYGKPENSFRISDHWNWYSTTKKCDDPKIIQCYSKDLPFARKREGDGLSSKPIRAYMVAVYRNGYYQQVYGEKFDRKTKSWSWVESSPEEVAALVCAG